MNGKKPGITEASREKSVIKRVHSTQCGPSGVAVCFGQSPRYETLGIPVTKQSPVLAKNKLRNIVTYKGIRMTYGDSIKQTDRVWQCRCGVCRAKVVITRRHVHLFLHAAGQEHACVPSLVFARVSAMRYEWRAWRDALTFLLSVRTMADVRKWLDVA